MSARICGTDKNANPNETTGGVDDLDVGGAAIPQVGFGNDLLQLRAHLVDADSPVEVEVDLAEQLGGVAGPVLEWRCREVGGRQHEAALIPNAHDDVGESDLFDTTPFAVGDHNIIHSDGIAEGELHSRKNVSESGLGGDTGDDADEACGSQHASPQSLCTGESQEDRTNSNDDDDGSQDAPNELNLSADAASGTIVGNINRVAVQSTIEQQVDDRNEYPATCSYH